MSLPVFPLYNINKSYHLRLFLFWQLPYVLLLHLTQRLQPDPQLWGEVWGTCQWPFLLKINLGTRYHSELCNVCPVVSPAANKSATFNVKFKGKFKVNNR